MYQGGYMRKMVLRSMVVLAASSTGLFALFGPHASISSFNNGSNDEVCVYCHTPHNSRNNLGPIPLWNKPATDLELTNGFTMYGAATTNIEGETIAGTLTSKQPQSMTLACLSCHDGVSAMNSVINAPGSGRVNATDGIIIGEIDPKPIRNDVAVTIGKDGNLADDHPLSIDYIEGKASLKPTSTVISGDGWYRANTIGDLLRNGKVECVSCHDPHGTPYGLYTRQQRSGSKLCLGCHNK